MICVGTSGFSYQGWKGFFYPDDVKDSQMLPFYASRLNCVEVNSSFYAVPSRATSCNGPSLCASPNPPPYDTPRPTPGPSYTLLGNWERSCR